MFMYPNCTVKDFSSWCKAVNKEAAKFRECFDYLTEKGKTRYHVFVVLSDIAQFCGTATEMVQWLRTGEELSADDIECVKSIDASIPIYCLKQIAETEDD